VEKAGTGWGAVVVWQSGWAGAGSAGGQAGELIDDAPQTAQSYLAQAGTGGSVDADGAADSSAAQASTTANGAFATGSISWTQMLRSSGPVALEGSLVAAAALPLALPAGCTLFDYQQNGSVEVWRATTQASCVDTAASLLANLEAGGGVLVQDGYLDLGGQAWGCTVRWPLAQDLDAALVVTLIPQTIGIGRSDSNLLVVSIMRISLPEQYLPEQYREAGHALG